MTPKQAYLKLCNYMNMRPTVVSCREYRTAYGFYITAPGTPKRKINFVGGSMFCVDKKTGKVFKSDDKESDLTGKFWIPVKLEQIGA